jgi:hypothetical protein
MIYNKKLTKLDFYLILFIIVLSLVIKLSAFSSVVVAGDSISHATLGENLADGEGYKINGQQHNHWPPVFAVFIALFQLILNNPITSMKLVSLLFGTLTLILVYIFSRRLDISSHGSLLISLLVLFNPFFLYFAGGILPLSEPLSIFFLLLGFYTYFIYKNNIFLSSVFFSLALFTRLNYIGPLLPFLLLHFYYLIKQKNILKNLLFLGIIVGPTFLWFLINKLLIKVSLPSEYLYPFSIEHLSHMPTLTVAYLLGLFYLFLTLFPLIIASMVVFLKKGNKFWILFILSSIFSFAIIFLNLYYVKDYLFFPFSRTRYLTGIVPLLTIMIYLTVVSMKNIYWRRIFKTYLIFSLIIFILLSQLLTNCAVITQVNKYVDTPNTFLKRSCYRSEAIDWVNFNVPDNSLTLVHFKEGDFGLQGIEVYYSEYFNPNLNVLALSKTPDKYLRDIITFVDLKEFESQLISLKLNRNNFGIKNLNHNFLITDANIDKLKPLLTSKTYQHIELLELFSTSYNYPVKVYQINFYSINS